MKILKKDPGSKAVRLMVETLDDLWHLQKILSKGDIIRSRTMRKTVIKSGNDFRYGEKKPVTLTIEAEKIEFKKDSNILRITGPIKEGPDDISRQSYHTIKAEVGTKLTIVKEWRKYHLAILEKSRVKHPLLLICVLDRETANFAVLMESGIEHRSAIENHDKEDMDSYYGEILKYIERTGEEYKKIVVAGPGFDKENLYRHAKERKSPVLGKIIVEKTSQAGTAGVREVVESSSSRILKETRVSKESEHVGELLKRMRKEEKVVYGPEETRNAVEYGAVETLLVSEERVGDFEDIMEKVEKQQGNVVIIGGDHEKGEQFLHLGGIAGFLRFEVE